MYDAILIELKSFEKLFMIKTYRRSNKRKMKNWTEVK